MGIREKIRKSSSEKEINSLLSEGYKFQDASQKTIKSWKSAAKARLIELSQPKVVETSNKSTKPTNTNTKSKSFNKKPRSKNKK